MYHHFASKRELFEAVFREVSDQTIRRAVRRTGNGGGSPLAELTNACLAWLREVQDPSVAFILLDQGPHVLGWKRARDLEAETSLGLMAGALESAVAAGEVDVVSVRVTAQLLNALLTEAALVALDDAPEPSPAELEVSIRQFIAGLAPT